MKVAGLGVDFISAMAPGGNAFEVLPQLWGRVSALIEGVVGDGAASAFNSWMVGAIGEAEQAAGTAEGLLNYFAGVRVDGLAEQQVQALVNAGLQVRSYSAGRFAVCEHVGPLEGLGDTTAWFYQTWLPAEGLEERWVHHYEIYDERFDMNSPHSVVMICAPVV